MTKILYIRKPCKCGENGIGRYCEALHDMFEKHDIIQPLPITNYPTKKSFLFHYYYKFRPLIKAIRETDIVHINGYTDMGTVQAFLVAFFLRKKIIYTAHWHPFKMLTHPNGGKFFFKLFLRPLVHYFANCVICINNEDFAYFSKINKNSIKIPHWFNNVSSYTSTISKKKNMILFVGRINDRVKGIQHLFALEKGKYDIHCVGYGDFSFKRNDMTHHQNISDEELSKLYSQASLLVIPSLYEAFSYVALESFSFGTPVVMSERVRIADYIKGLKGYSTFKYGDLKDFKEKVEQTIGTQVDTNTILKIFDINKIQKQYETIYLN